MFHQYYNGGDAVQPWVDFVFCADYAVSSLNWLGKRAAASGSGKFPDGASGSTAVK
jgi:hypothetical protein